MLNTFLKVGVVLLGERQGAEIAAGARPLLAPGRQRAGARALARGLPRLRGRGYAKAALAFLVRPEDGGSRVITETRVAGTSPDATRGFQHYWRV